MAKPPIPIMLDGVNVRGAAILADTPKLLSLVTVAGNLSPIDPLHLQAILESHA